MSKKYLIIVVTVNLFLYLVLIFAVFSPFLLEIFDPFFDYLIMFNTPFMFMFNIIAALFAFRKLRPFDKYARIGILINITIIILLIFASIFSGPKAI